MFKRLAVLGCLGTVVPIAAVLGGLLVAGDVAARRYATGQLADRVSAATPGASGVHARIHSFPFVARALLNRSVSAVGVHIDHLAGTRGVTFNDLDVDLRGVVLDGHALLNDRSVKLKRIHGGSVRVSLTSQALSDATGRAVRITGGRLDVTVLGRTVHGNVRVTPARSLDMQLSPLPDLVVPLPSEQLLPCKPEVTFGEGAVTLACTFSEVPAAFVEVSAPLVPS